MEWNEENDKRLKQLIAERYSLSEIAKMMGTTRGSISGRCHRGKLNLLSRSFSQEKVRKSDNIGNGITTAERIVINAKKKQQFVEVKQETSNVECPPSKNIPFENNKGCKDITDIKLSTCCGHPLVPGKSYCEYHHKLYSMGVPQRRRYGP